MPVWSERRSKVEIKDFEDGLNDARRNTVDHIAYQINQEYQKGVEIAHQLIKTLETTRSEMLSRPIERTSITAKLSTSEKALGLA
ncbi:MAG: hypothetical protein O7E52_06865 [Candidatus Poribacteria bacterium]|nr:hypothetical protein [Candidatus Poribacteria bacterium]